MPGKSSARGEVGVNLRKRNILMNDQDDFHHLRRGRANHAATAAATATTTPISVRLWSVNQHMLPQVLLVLIDRVPARRVRDKSCAQEGLQSQCVAEQLPLYRWRGCTT